MKHCQIPDSETSDDVLEVPCLETVEPTTIEELKPLTCYVIPKAVVLIHYQHY